MLLSPAPPRSSLVDDLLATLSPREKIGQTCQERLTPDIVNHPDLEAFFARYPIGSLFCGGEIIRGPESTPEQTREILHRCQQASPRPLLVAGDLEYGAGAAVRGLTQFPHMMALGAAGDEALAYDVGRLTALEGRHVGFNWTFAPVVDLLKNWLNPIVGSRALGDAPGPVGRLAVQILRGLQDHGMAACAKHFPGDGIDFRDQHLVTSINSLPEEEWWAQFGHVYRAVIDGGVETIMAGHIALPWMDAVDPATGRPRPATVSHAILTTLLRERLGFNGVLVSDALIMAGYTGWAPREVRLLKAVRAGVDVMLWPGYDYFQLMERALEEGTLSMERLDTAVRRVLTLKARLGLLPEPSAPPASRSSGPPLAEITSEARQLSHTIARRSITLVRDRDRQLPLSPSKVKRLLLHLAIPTELPGLTFPHLDRLRQRLTHRGIQLTVLTNGNCEALAQLEAEGRRWDAYVVVYSLLHHQHKNTLRPTGAMAEVMWSQQHTETLRPIVVAINSPYLLYDMPYLGTLINVHGTSPASMDALDEALFGEIPFRGKLPVRLQADPWLQALDASALARPE